MKNARTKRRPAATPLDLGTPERALKGDLATRAVVNDAGSTIGHGRRAQAPVERLARSLSGPMLAAADRLRRDYECAVWRISDRDRPIEPRVQRTRRVAEPTDLMIDAGRRVAAARAAMGDYTAEVVIAVVCDELDAQALGARRGQNRQEIVGVLKAGLDIVARCYGVERGG